jgi:phosphatidylglycerophosphatase A
MKKAKDFAVKVLASGFGLGFLPKAPGTFGTLLGIPFAYFLHYRGAFPYMLVTVLFSFFAVIISEMAGPLFGEPDSPKIVIDEVAGFLVTMTWLPMTWQSLLIGFILFRIFDAVKPGPIGYLDRKVKGGLGVVIDDLAAGIAANIILQFIYVYTNVLGAQLP